MNTPQTIPAPAGRKRALLSPRAPSLPSIASLLMLLSGFAPLLAGDVYRGTDLGDIVVAVIKKVGDGPHTNGQPPLLVIEVSEVLRGDKKRDRSTAVWDPPYHGVDWGVPERDPIYLAWLKRPLAPPIAGDKFILWGGLEATSKNADGSERFHISAIHRYPYSDEKRKWALAEIRRAERERKQREQEAKAEAGR